MSLKKLFSSLTLIGIFVLGTILIIGAVSTKNFIYAFSAFMIFIGIMSFFLFYEYAKEISDKIILAIAIIFIVFSISFFMIGFKSYAYSMHKNNAIVNAQAVQNNDMMQSNIQKIEYANNIKAGLDQNKQNSLLLSANLDSLINSEKDIITNNEDLLYQQLLAEEQARLDAIEQARLLAIEQARQQAILDALNNQNIRERGDDD